MTSREVSRMPSRDVSTKHERNLCITPVSQLSYKTSSFKVKVESQRQMINESKSSRRDQNKDLASVSPETSTHGFFKFPYPFSNSTSRDTSSNQSPKFPAKVPATCKLFPLALPQGLEGGGQKRVVYVSQAEK